jgi:hypothetical protein
LQMNLFERMNPDSNKYYLWQNIYAIGSKDKCRYSCVVKYIKFRLKLFFFTHKLCVI